jgi:hypothetical protein
MAKAALLNVLKRTLGEYVDGLDAESLHVSIRKGSVDLRNLSLKHEAIESLQLPVRVTRGHLGKVLVKVPWSHLGSQSVTISIQDVYLQLAPRDSTDWGDVEKAAIAAKREKLEIQELLRQQRASFKNSIVEEESSQEEKGMSWSKKLATVIAENIEIEIKNVHIRYEDLQSRIALGFTISSVTVATTNRQGDKVFVTDRKDSLLYKVLSVCGVAVYCDPDPVEQAGLADVDWAQQMRSFVSEQPSEHHLISPATCHIHLAKDDNPAASPNCKIETRLENLATSISSKQLQRLIGLQQRMAPSVGKASKYAKYRPQASVFEDPRAWWRYAAKASVLICPPVNWHTISRAVRERREYINLYKRSQMVAWLEPLSAGDTQRMQELEHSPAAHCSVARLLLYRSLAEAELGVEFGKKHAAANSSKSRRRSTLRFMKKRAQLEDMTDVQLTGEERSELHAAVGDVVLLPSTGSDPKGDPNIVTYKVRVDLPSCSFTLKDHAFCPMLSLYTCGCYCVQLTAMQGALTVEGSFSVFQMQDRCTPNTLFPLLLDTTPASTATVPDSVDAMARADRCTFKNPSLKHAQLKPDEGVMWFHILIYPDSDGSTDTEQTETTSEATKPALQTRNKGAMVTDVRARMGGIALAIQPDVDALFSKLQEEFSIPSPDPAETAFKPVVPERVKTQVRLREEQLTDYAFSQQDCAPKIRCTLFAKAPHVVFVEDCTNSDSAVLVADFGSLSLVDAEPPRQAVDGPATADRWWFQTSEIQLLTGKLSELLSEGNVPLGVEVASSESLEAHEPVEASTEESSASTDAKADTTAAFEKAALLRKQHPEHLVGKRIVLTDFGKVRGR